MEDNNNAKTIDERFATIEKILTRLESPEVSLEESFELYKSGMTELQNANAAIEQTRKAVLAIGKNDNMELFEE